MAGEPATLQTAPRVLQGQDSDWEPVYPAEKKSPETYFLESRHHNVSELLQRAKYLDGFSDVFLGFTKNIRGPFVFRSFSAVNLLRILRTQERLLVLETKLFEDSRTNAPTWNREDDEELDICMKRYGGVALISKCLF